MNMKTIEFNESNVMYAAIDLNTGIGKQKKCGPKRPGKRPGGC